LSFIASAQLAGSTNFSAIGTVPFSIHFSTDRPFLWFVKQNLYTLLSVFPELIYLLTAYSVLGLKSLIDYSIQPYVLVCTKITISTHHKINFIAFAINSYTMDGGITVEKLQLFSNLVTKKPVWFMSVPALRKYYKI
jgi:hypothetical protein